MGTTMLTMMVLVGASHQEPQQSYVEQKSALVMRSFLTFKSARTVEEDQDRLGQARARDALLLGGRAPSLQSGALGSMMLSAAIALVAHAPRPLRVVVDGPVHLGPALFEGGGMGAGVGGRF